MKCSDDVQALWPIRGALRRCRSASLAQVHTHTLTLGSGFSHRTPAALSPVWETQRVIGCCSRSERWAHPRPRHHVGVAGGNPEEKGPRGCWTSSSVGAHQPPGGTPAALGSVGAPLVSQHASVWTDTVYFRVPLLPTTTLSCKRHVSLAGMSPDGEGRAEGGGREKGGWTRGTHRIRGHRPETRGWACPQLSSLASGFSTRVSGQPL